MSIHLSTWPKPITDLMVDTKEKEEFKKAIAIIGEIRKYKSENQLSLGKTIPEFPTKIKVKPEYLEFIKAVAKVEKIVSKSLNHRELAPR